MLTWIMFLKFLDDMEQIAEQEAKMAGKRFRPALEPPYRWRDWAAKPDGVTGDELISFVNNEDIKNDAPSNRESRTGDSFRDLGKERRHWLCSC
jgi:hypothetical protein